MSVLTDKTKTMETPTSMPTAQTYLSDIVGILDSMLEDWGVDAGPIGLDTRLVADLQFASVDIIHLAVAIEEHYRKPRLGFQELLMKDGRYVDDVTVQQLVDFVAAKLGE